LAVTDAPYDASDAPTGQAYTATPSTEDDVELVARALWEQCDAPSDGPTSVCYEDARAALSALAAAGRLVPADAHVETDVEYEVELTYPDGTVAYTPVGPHRDVAEALAASPAHWQTPGRPGVIRQRTVTTVVSPWQPAPTEETDRD